MKDRLKEIDYKYTKQIDNDNKTIRINKDDYLELLGMAEIAAYSFEEQSNE